MAPPQRALLPAPVAVALSLGMVHSSVTLKHGSMLDELPEQEMAMAFLDGTERVLEIGGNVGRNSIVIDRMQRGRGGSLVVLESDPDVAAQLTENKLANGCAFEVVVGALSKGPVYQEGWASVRADAPPSSRHRPVPTVDIARLGASRCFDALVADCEGALAQILDDYPELLDGVRTVVIENDFIDDTDKRRVHGLFASRGLSVVYQRGLFWGVRGEWIPDFYQVWAKN